MRIVTTIAGIQAAQAANLKIIAALQEREGTALGRTVLYAAADLHRYAVAVTHVDTGALRASQRIRAGPGARAEIYIDPSSRNPRTGVPPARYGPVEHARGGSHAFYERTFYERIPDLAPRAAAYFFRQLPG